MALKYRQGFTLIELIMVILILSIVSIVVTSFISFGFEIYQDTNGRQRQISDSRFVVERVTRELREALPNSVRVSSGGECVEFVPIVASSSYIDIPVLPDAPSNTVTVIDNGLSLTGGGYKMVVYPLQHSDVYGSSDRNFDIASFGSASANIIPITLTSAIQFAKDSPTQRYFIIKELVSYCQTSNDTMVRYSGYDTNAIQPTPSSGFFINSAAYSGVLMAERQQNSAPFSVMTATLQRNSVMLIQLEFAYNDELLRLYNEVHIVNTP